MPSGGRRTGRRSLSAPSLDFITTEYDRFGRAKVDFAITGFRRYKFSKISVCTLCVAVAVNAFAKKSSE